MDRRRFWRTRKREGLKVEGQPGSLSWSQDELGRLAVALGSPSAEVMLREDLQRLEGCLLYTSPSPRD